MKNQFFVYTKEGIYKSFVHYYHLLNFLRLRNWGKFGHSFKDKRRVTIKVKDTWSYKGNVFLMGPTKLIKIKYIAKDINGKVLNCKKLEDDAYYAENFKPDYSKIRYIGWKARHQNYPGFRKGPVPYTGGWGRYCWLRHIKTTQERRLNCTYKKYVRAKRKNLPSYWDDIKRSDTNRTQSWKRSKKCKQWM